MCFGKSEMGWGGWWWGGSGGGVVVVLALCEVAAHVDTVRWSLLPVLYRKSLRNCCSTSCSY